MIVARLAILGLFAVLLFYSFATLPPAQGEDDLETQAGLPRPTPHDEA